jgi:hypothetical protein
VLGKNVLRAVSVCETHFSQFSPSIEKVFEIRCLFIFFFGSVAFFRFPVFSCFSQRVVSFSQFEDRTPRIIIESTEGTHFKGMRLSFHSLLQSVQVIKNHVQEKGKKITFCFPNWRPKRDG